MHGSCMCFRFSLRNSRPETSRLDLHSASALCISQRQNSTQVIPSPTLEGETKSYAPKIQKLVSEISQLTLIEVADLNELLKVRSWK